MSENPYVLDKQRGQKNSLSSIIKTAQTSKWARSENEVHTAVVTFGCGLSGAAPAGSLDLVYMRCLDTGKPCAALPRHNSLHYQHCCPRLKSMHHRPDGCKRLQCLLLLLWFFRWDSTTPLNLGPFCFFNLGFQHSRRWCHWNDYDSCCWWTYRHGKTALWEVICRVQSILII